MAGRAGSAGDERAQAVPRDCAILDSDLCPELRRAPRWAKGQALLRAGVSRYRHRHSDHRHTPRRAGVPDSYSQPYGVLKRVPGAACPRAPLPDSSRGYPAEDAMVPTITKKSLEEIATFV